MTAVARLSFWAPAQRMDEFKALYEKRLVPILQKHELMEGCESGRAGVEDIFSRLFELASPADVAVREQSLHKDPAWHEALRDLGTRFGTSFAAIHADEDTHHYGYFSAGMVAQMAELIHYQFGLYSAPAGAGRVVEAGAGFRDGAWQALSVVDGLPDSVVQGILEDREGYLWFATRGGGVCRYDGAEFVNFAEEDGLAGNDVLALLEDREGNVWFSTHRGACRYDGTEFITFTIQDGLAGNWVCYMLEDRAGHLWFGMGGGGVSRYDGRKFTTFTMEDGLADNYITSILEDRQGNMWFGTRESGASRFDGACFSTLTTADGLLHNRVNALLEDREGYLWFGTGSWEEGGHGGASRYDGQEFVHFTTADGLGLNEVWSILEDRQGNLWFGTLGGGVSRYDGQGFGTFTTEDGLANDRVTCVVEDRAGRVWIGTWEGGVSCYAEKEIQTFTTADGLFRDAHIYLMTDRQGCVWIGSRKGAFRYDGEQLHPLDALKGRWAYPRLEDRAGNLWLITDEEGVSRYDGREFTRFAPEDGLAHFWVTCLVEDRQGHFWFGTNAGGVSRYDGQGFKTFNTEDGLGGNRVLAAMEDREGYLWFGTDGGGVSRFDGCEFKTFTIADGLVHDKVSCMLEDREGYLWFGTDGGGVSRFDGREFKTFTTRDGLTHNRMNSMLEDREGHLWFGSRGGGVSRYDGRVFQRLTRQDGLANDGVGHHMVQDGHGDVWIATAGGLTRYHPQRIPPTLRLKDVIADRRYGPVEEIQLAGAQRILTFEFQGISWTTRPDGMAYVYRLEGFDADWQTTRERRVVYQDLELGHYTFQVKAVDRDLNYSEPAAVEVNVLPNIYIEALNEALSASGASGEFVGKSPALLRVQEQLAEVAPTQVTVFIAGETGTGKGLAARTVHGLSSNKAGPFIQVNCGAIPDSLVESELFGHERGAFTGAVDRKLGKVELASGGTLFLDEIGDMPLEAQVKLLRFLDEHAFERLGGTETIKPEVRIITATNRDLLQMVAAGRFREDLYFRLQVFPVRLPPLREREADIPFLATYFMERMAAHLQKEVNYLTPEALIVLQGYEWPGNVRELEHTLQRAVIVCPGQAIQARDISLQPGTPEEEPAEDLVPMEQFERRYICRVLEHTGWVISGARGAAAVLRLKESTLRGRMRKLGIKRPGR